MPIDQVVIGSCTNGRISDLRAGRGDPEGPQGRGRACAASSSRPPRRSTCRRCSEGLSEIFIDGRARSSPRPTCGPCLGGHMGILAEGERAVATTNRNFVGRMGHVEARSISPARPSPRRPPSRADLRRPRICEKEVNAHESPEQFYKYGRQRRYRRHHPRALPQHLFRPRSWPPTAWRTSTRTSSSKVQAGRHHRRRRTTSAAAPRASTRRSPSRRAASPASSPRRFARIFYRNSINIGLPDPRVPGGRAGDPERATPSRSIFATGVIRDDTTGQTFQAAAVPAVHPAHHRAQTACCPI